MIKGAHFRKFIFCKTRDKFETVQKDEIEMNGKEEKSKRINFREQSRY